MPDDLARCGGLELCTTAAKHLLVEAASRWDVMLPTHQWRSGRSLLPAPHWGKHQKCSDSNPRRCVEPSWWWWRWRRCGRQPAPHRAAARWRGRAGLVHTPGGFGCACPASAPAERCRELPRWCYIQVWRDDLPPHWDWLEPWPHLTHTHTHNILGTTYLYVSAVLGKFFWNGFLATSDTWFQEVKL